jgi:uncharacterized membrane protein
MKNLRFLLLLAGAAAILSVPLIAMQFTNEVDWDATDFIIAGILLFGTAIVIELVSRKAKTPGKRALYIILVLLTLFLIWAELAVGIFGTPFAGS